MDRKTSNVVTQIKRNENDVKDLKSTQYSGSDSITINYIASPNVYDMTQAIAAGQRWTFYYQTFDSTSFGYDDANYDVGLIKVYVDNPAITQYQGLKTTSTSTGLNIISVGFNTIEFENGCYWAIQLTNLDSVSHTVYVKGYLNTTGNAGSTLFFTYGSQLS